MAERVFENNDNGGYLRRESNSDNWATIRGASEAGSNTGGDFVLQDQYNIEAVNNSGSFFGITRSLIGWDTSSLPDSAIINSFKVRINLSSLDGNPNTCFIHAVATTWDPSSDIVATNYNDFAFVSLGNVAFASVGANTDITISDTSGVDTSGNTQIMLISDRDLNNSAPSDSTPDNKIVLTTTIQAVIDFSSTTGQSVII